MNKLSATIKDTGREEITQARGQWQIPILQNEAMCRAALLKSGRLKRVHVQGHETGLCYHSNSAVSSFLFILTDLPLDI